MKQRTNYLDLEILINEIRPEILNYRLQNIYDLASSSRQFLLKFGQPNSKKSILVDPGFRIHLTNYSRSTAPTPSGFVAKLRKHLKTRRITKISLAKANRTVVFSFSDDFSYHLVFEFFAGGNLLLLNKEHTILALQRVVSATENHARYAVGENYDITSIIETSTESKTDENYESPITLDVLKTIIDKAVHGQSDALDDQEATENVSALERQPKKKPRKKPSSMPLKKLLYLTFSEIASGIIEATLESQGVDPNLSSSKFKELSDVELEKIFVALKLAEKQSLELIASDKVTGYIVAEKRTEKDGMNLLSSASYSADKSIDIQYVYEDFIPYRPNIPQEKLDSGAITIITTETFNDAVDKYFSTIEAAKLSIKFSQQEMAAIKRLESARTENQKRVAGLLQVQEKNELYGTALQMYASRVEEACDAVRTLVENGMDWTDMENLIKIEKQRQNAVAQMIKLPLNLAKNSITLILPNPNQVTEEESDSDKEFSDSESEAESSEDEKDEQNDGNSPNSQGSLNVEVDLSLSAFANARKYFDVKRTAQTKQERTISQADSALKRAEIKIKKDLKHTLEKGRGQQTDLQWVRNPFWFEKFYWFQSSDGYLCLAGRDYMQNEMLLQKLFKENDIYVHCEVPGAAVVIIKNHLNSQHIPPTTLTQAGTFSVASSSKAWDSKMNASAWWATRSQIPKVTEHGDIVTTDFVVVNGEGKHYLPPSQLDMGLGFLWLIPETSVNKYPRKALGTFSSAGDTAYNGGKNTDASDDENFPDANILSDDEDFPDAEVLSDEEDVSNQEEASEGSEEPENAEPENEEPEKEELDNEEPEKELGNAEPDHEELGAGESDEKEATPAASTPEPKSEFELEDTDAAQDQKETPTDEAETPSHILEIERELEELKVGRRKVRDIPKKETKKSKKKKLLQAQLQNQRQNPDGAQPVNGANKSIDKARLKREEEARLKREQEIKKREKAKKAKDDQLKKLLESQDNDEEDQGMDMSPFALLVPKLVAGDEPLAAVPVFAPWSALLKYKYKIKLQPGQTKKGKAVKDILHGFQSIKPHATDDVDYPQATELNAIRALKDTNVVLTLSVGKVKIAKLPGGQLKQSKTKGGSGRQKKK